MITPEREYLELEYLINDPNNLSNQPVYRIPTDEPVYTIDLDKREIEAPEFLSVLNDHNAEVIWFKVNRFYNDFDLFGSTCWIQYKNAENEEFISISIPQVIKESNHDMLYIPWTIGAAATKKAGIITFSFRFFKLTDDENPANRRVFYSLHTKPATSKVLQGMNIHPINRDELDVDLEEGEPSPYDEFLQIYQNLSADYARLNRDYEFYWIEV